MFANHSQTVVKWTLNRPYQSKFLEGLAEISGCSRSVSDQRKMLRPKEIKRSNLMVEQLAKVVEETFLNPFSKKLDNNQLFNIVSGKPMSAEISESLISVSKKGQEMIREYIQRMKRTMLLTV